MSQERVSYEIAKALKEAGYPQANNDLYYNENGTIRCCSPHTFTVTYACPTYLDTWLWLWREKKIQIVAEPRTTVRCYIKAPFYGLPLELAQSFYDPENAIIAGINHLVKNNLIN